MRISDYLRALGALSSLLALIAVFQSCGVVKRPQSAEMSSLSVDSLHGKAEIQATACQTCHESDRKSTDHNPGQDCKGCHLAGVSWRQTTSSAAHSPTPTQCAVCHGTGAPYNKFPSDHHEIFSADCIDCHQATIAAGFVSYAGAVQKHSAALTAANNCSLCHADTTKFDSFPQATHIAIGVQDCSSCHQAAITNNFTTWLGATFDHSPAIIADRNCASCHAAERPTAITLTNINPSINDVRVVNKTHFTAKDCFSCHTTPPTATLLWRGSINQFEHTNAAGTQVNFCLSCHISQSHIGQDGSVADDLVGDGKCQQCHQQRRSWNDSPRNTGL